MNVRPVSNSKEQAADFDVLPPEGKTRPGAAPTGPGGIRQQAISQIIAHLMDNLIKVPGTKKGIGLNPILDLLPVFGDGAATIVQMMTILEAARRGVPKIILARMGTNILINGAVGMFPGVGEAFAWWFRPSSRNYELLVKHAPQSGGSVNAPARRAGAGHYLFVFGLLAVVLVVMGMFITLGVLLVMWLWHAATGR